AEGRKNVGNQLIRRPFRLIRKNVAGMSSSHPPLPHELIEEDSLDRLGTADGKEPSGPFAAFRGKKILKPLAILMVQPQEFADGRDIQRLVGFAVDEPEIAGQLGIAFHRSEDL